MAFFDNVTADLSTQGVEERTIQKALTTGGYTTDLSAFTGGQALIPEDMESTLTNVLTEDENDCKLFASLHKQPVKSNIHEIVRRTGFGDHRFGFIGENEAPTESTQNLERQIYQTKYLATIGSVSKQMELAETVEGAYESEKIAAVNRIALNCETACFHGNSDVVDKEFDGFEAILRKWENHGSSDAERSTVADLHGLEIGVTSTNTDLLYKDTGRDLFNEIATKVYRKGGSLKRAFFAPELNMQFDRLYEDKLRYTMPASFGMEYLNLLPTSIGSEIAIRGKDAGADKLFHVKGEVVAAGNESLRPNAPSKLELTPQANTSDSHFYSGENGDYTYAVHAINNAGISKGVSATTAAVTVAVGGSVKLVITPPTNGPKPTGYIITRSNKDGDVLMEMVEIKANQGSTTEYIDTNRYLPGTGSIILLSATESSGRQAISFGQLLPLTSIPLPLNETLAHRFVVTLYGMLEVRNPEQHALIENVGYKGGLYHS